jgi:predicted metal-dependent hydrolase
LDKSNWIFSKIKEAESRKAVMATRELRPGNKLLFLGREFSIEVDRNDKKRSAVSFDGIRFIVYLPEDISFSDEDVEIKDRIIKWYKEQAREIIGGRLLHYSRIIGVDPEEIAVKTQKRLWGNCDYRKGKININWQIILSPMNIVDYVVVHELCHLIVPNHSKRFWSKVASFIPDFKERKLWLKNNAVKMEIYP